MLLLLLLMLMLMLLMLLPLLWLLPVSGAPAGPLPAGIGCSASL